MYKNLNLESLGISGLSSEIIESLLTNGFKGLDLEIVEFARQVQAQGLAKARRAVDSARLKLSSFALPVDWDADPDQQRREKGQHGPLAELAQQLGCNKATVLLPPASDVRPYHENFELCRRRLAEWGTWLASLNIQLGVGILAPTELRRGRAYQFIQTFDQLLLLLKMVNHPNVGVALDTWHWHLGGGTLDQLRNLGTLPVVSVALADCDADALADTVEDSARRLPGETGVIDHVAVVSLLADLNYAGPLTPQPHPSRLPNIGRDKVIRQAATALDAIWSAAGLSPTGKKTAALAGK